MTVGLAMQSPSKSAHSVPDTGFSAAFALGEPTYAIGKIVRVGNDSFQVDHPLKSFVQTTDGIVYADDQGRVWATAGDDEQQIGSLAWRYGHLVTDGPWVAWINAGSPEQITAFNQHTGMTESTPAEIGDRKGNGEFEDVTAIDGAAVLVQDERGSVNWDTGSDEVTVLADAAPSSLRVEDAKNGIFAWSVDPTAFQDDIQQQFGVGPDLASGTPIAAASGHLGQFRLSPDGTVLAAEVEDGVPGLFSTDSGQPLALDTSQFDFPVLHKWLSNDAIAGFGIQKISGADESTWRMDLLTCRVSTGACEVEIPSIGTFADHITLPVGQRMDD